MTEPPRSQRGRLLALGALLALLAICGAGYVLFVHEAPQPPPPPPAKASPPKPPQLFLTRVDGEVFVRHKGTDAGWTAAKTGDLLAASDEIRTSPSAGVEFGAAGAYTFRLEPGTVMSVDEIEATVSKFLVEQGMFTAEVAPGESSVVVRAGNSDAVATTRGGSFVMSNSGKGTVAVGTQKGEVELKAAGKAVIVRSGQQAFALAGSPPTDPTPIPTSLFLKVQWPEETELNRRRVVVAGRTAPGSHVIAGGAVIPVERDGRFKGVLILHEGANTVRLTTRDVGGRVDSSEKKIAVDSTAPPLSTEKLPWEKP